MKVTNETQMQPIVQLFLGLSLENQPLSFGQKVSRLRSFCPLILNNNKSSNGDKPARPQSSFHSVARAWGESGSESMEDSGSRLLLFLCESVEWQRALEIVHFRHRTDRRFLQMGLTTPLVLAWRSLLELKAGLVAADIQSSLCILRSRYMYRYGWVSLRGCIACARS